MKILDKLPAFVLGAVAATAVLYMTGIWDPAKAKRVEEFERVLKAAADATEQLKTAQHQQLEALRAVERAMAEAVAARRSGDARKAMEAEGAAKRAEAEAQKQDALVKQREAAAAAAREAANTAAKAMDKARPPIAEPRVNVPQSQPVPIQPKPLDGLKPSDSAVNAQKLAEQVRPAEAAAAAAQEAAKRAKELADKMDAAKGDRKADEPRSEIPGLDPLVHARQLEAEGKFADAVRVYRRAARAGSGPASKRLGEIYAKGVPGVGRDFAESLQWYEMARLRGETVPTAQGR